jgi:hypothetical protein
LTHRYHKTEDRFYYASWVYLLSLKPRILALDFRNEALGDLAIWMKLTNMRRRLVRVDRVLAFNANEGQVVDVDKIGRSFQKRVINDRIFVLRDQAFVPVQT